MINLYLKHTESVWLFLPPLASTVYIEQVGVMQIVWPCQSETQFTTILY